MFAEDFHDSHIKKLALCLSKLPLLQSFLIDSEKYSDPPDTELKPLFLALKNLLLLSKVSIRLGNPQGWSPWMFHDLFSGLAACKSLKKLHLDMRPVYDRDPSSADPIALGLNLLNVSSLEEISLPLYETYEDRHLAQLSQTLTKFSSLKALKIDFSKRGSLLSDQGLLHFACSKLSLHYQLYLLYVFGGASFLRQSSLSLQLLLL